MEREGCMALWLPIQCLGLLSVLWVINCPGQPWGFKLTKKERAIGQFWYKHSNV